MTKDERDAARARCRAATPGPWLLECESRDAKPVGTAVLFGHGGASIDGRCSVVLVADYTDGPPNPDDNDLDFIAHARADLPAALDELDAKDAEVGRLRAEVAQLRKFLGVCRECNRPYYLKAKDALTCECGAGHVETDAEVERLRAENAELRKQIEERNDYDVPDWNVD